MSPIIYIVHSLANGSFLDSPFRFGSISLFCSFPFLVFSGDIPVAYLDGTVEKQFIFKINYLFERKKSHMNIQFSDNIEIEKVAIVEIDSYISENVPLEQMERMA